MVKKAPGRPRQGESLTRERIIEASIELLDSSGEVGLTFRALSERLSTGPGAIYWHIANKSDLLSAACDAVVARAMDETVVTTPKETIRAVALGTLIAYILGVSKQNADNGQLARTRGFDRSDFLEAMSTAWSQLDPRQYPFARSVAGQFREHDDRVDFISGIDLILKGIDSPRHRSGPQHKHAATLQR
jgi:AcrR family transcriptional regulator